MVRKLNCSLKKNKNNSLFKRKIKTGEAIFSVIMPKRDNSGQKINNKLYQKYISKINNRFGGATTMPSVLGCFVNEQSGRTELSRFGIITEKIASPDFIFLLHRELFLFFLREQFNFLTIEKFYLFPLLLSRMYLLS